MYLFILSLSLFSFLLEWALFYAIVYFAFFEKLFEINLKKKVSLKNVVNCRPSELKVHVHVHVRLNAASRLEFIHNAIIKSSIQQRVKTLPKTLAIMCGSRLQSQAGITSPRTHTYGCMEAHWKENIIKVTSTPPPSSTSRVPTRFS